MSVDRNIIVLKCGSSVLRTDSDCPKVIGEIYRHVREGHRVVVVVSAFEGRTDQLAATASAISDEPDATSLATLLATGELQSGATLTLHLQRAGLSATLADHHRLGLRTGGSLLHAEPRTLDLSAIEACLEKHAVLVVPGFVGVHEDGRTSLLGRGGSDLTAIFLAGQLYASRCLLLKDVDGLYDHDPNAVESIDDRPRPNRFEAIPFGPALQLEAPLVQTEAIARARDEARPFEVGGLNASHTTRIGANSTRFGAPCSSDRPLRVALLGGGHVGRAVIDQLAHFEDVFEIVGLGVRDPFKPRSFSNQAPFEIGRAESILQLDPDVVVELIGGLNPARTYVSRALSQGHHVVTANKQLIARHGVALQDLARREGSTLKYSASVGGSVPMIEAVRRHAQHRGLESLRGVLNGTCNFILEQLEQGDSWADALDAARTKGLAETEAAFDLEGLDAAHKLIILSREAFGVELPLASISRRSLDVSVIPFLKRAQAEGTHLRQVSECTRKAGSVKANVKFVPLEPDDPLKPYCGTGNTLELKDARSVVGTIEGLGAGGIPTATSVIADLLEIARDRGTPLVSSSRSSSVCEVKS